MKKLLLLFAAALSLAFTTRADSVENLTTTGSVTATVGCWNPAVCGDPLAYWTAWDLPVPVVEPPASDFGAGVWFDWSHDPQLLSEYWSADTVATPEPSSLALLGVPLVLFILRGRRYSLK